MVRTNNVLLGIYTNVLFVYLFYFQYKVFCFLILSDIQLFVFLTIQFYIQLN
uniref:Uncharacterized protein n=1 Tax=Meloidogyne enterolobii TaxID=390850 RepID=A0A6V7UPN9_MELEN|nr:unnamed protein product [Meloidogyne enterolobii]